MEPWQEEEMRHWKVGGPRCVCCGQAVQSERMLDLRAFGLSGVSCESCTEKAVVLTESA